MNFSIEREKKKSEGESKSDHVQLNVYFGGTASSFNNNTTQIELFGKWDSAEALNNEKFDEKISKDRDAFKLMFDGW